MMQKNENKKIENRLSNIMKQLEPKQISEKNQKKIKETSTTIKDEKKKEIKFFPTKEEILKVSKEIEIESEINFKNLIPFKYLEEELKKEIIENLKKNDGIDLSEKLIDRF